jgi:hypothetical protein
MIAGKSSWQPLPLTKPCKWRRDAFLFLFFILSLGQVAILPMLAGVGKAVLWSRSQGVEIKLPLQADITNCSSGSFLFTTDLKKFYVKKS